MSKETKDRKEDFYWLTTSSRLFLSRGMLAPGQSGEDRIAEIAKRANEYYGDSTGDEFYDHASQGCYSLSSPFWANFMKDRGLPISCFGSLIDDTMVSIITKHAEMAMMSKMGGGTSAYFGKVRPRGAPITGGSESFGPVHFMEMFDCAAQVISQGATRRGSFAAYLPIDHPDIHEFLMIQSDTHPIQHMSFGVCVPDKWMEEMIAGDSAKRFTWSKVIKKRFETGYPYIFFSDTVNDNKPQWYKDQDRVVYASNLCLIGSTIIEVSYSADGRDSIKMTLEDFNQKFASTDADVYTKSWCTESSTYKWSKVTASAQTGTASELICIESPNGNTIECTPDHKILTTTRGWVCAKDLNEDDELIESN